MTNEYSCTSGTDRKLLSFIEKASFGHLMTAAIITYGSDYF